MKVKDWKKINKDMHIHGDIKQRKAEVALLLSDKVNFRAERINGVKRGTLHDKKRVNLPTRLSNPKCPCTKQQSYKICEQKPEGQNKKRETTAVVETSPPLSQQLMENERKSIMM